MLMMANSSEIFLPPPPPPQFVSLSFWKQILLQNQIFHFSILLDDSPQKLQKQNMMRFHETNSRRHSFFVPTLQHLDSTPIRLNHQDELFSISLPEQQLFE